MSETANPELRPATEADIPLLEAVYASTRAEELALTDWSDDQKAAFCHMQFEAQRAHYSKFYDGASFQVIEVEGRPAGRLYVARWTREIRIVDITLLPDFRGQGYGTGLLRKLQDEARSAGKTLTIHVERMNAALRLYYRLGFRVAEDKGVYFLMEWQATV